MLSFKFSGMEYRAQIPKKCMCWKCGWKLVKLLFNVQTLDCYQSCWSIIKRWIRTYPKKQTFFCFRTFIKWSQTKKISINFSLIWHHPEQIYMFFFASIQIPPLTYYTAPKLHLICTIPINRFQISCEYFKHEHRGQGSVEVTQYAHTDTNAPV